MPTVEIIADISQLNKFSEVLIHYSVQIIQSCVDINIYKQSKPHFDYIPTAHKQDVEHAAWQQLAARARGGRARVQATLQQLSFSCHNKARDSFAIPKLST